jgi:hypothetical protein
VSLYFKRDLGDPLAREPFFFQRVDIVSSWGSCRSRVLRGMGARGCLLYTEQVPGDLLTLIPHRGSPCFELRVTPLEGFTWHGCPRLPTLHRAGPGRPSHAVVHRGSPLSRAEDSPRSRALLAWQGAWAFNCPAGVAAGFAARARLFRRCGRARAQWATWPADVTVSPRSPPVLP